MTVPLTKKGDRIRLLSAKWYGEYVDGDDITQRVPLSTDKTSAQQMLAELVRRAELERSGVRDPFRDHRKRPLTAHRDDWEASLRANNRDDDYVKLKLARLNAILDGCRFVFTADLAANRLELVLAKLRQAKGPEVPGLSIQTSNDYLQAAKQFTRWLVENDRLDLNPFARLKGGNVKLDRRHNRRDLPPAEMSKLLVATRESNRAFRGLSGEDRFHLYLTAFSTGFRSSELATLTPESFALAGNPPTATLAAEFTKNRRPATQPLPPEVVAALRDFLSGRSAGTPVWAGTWSDRSADMLKVDLAAAGIPYEVEGPDGPLFADFHALRHSFITMLERAGISPKTAQVLARHSDVRLTLQRYTHKTLRDLGAAVESFPSVLPKTDHPKAAARATGTDGRSAPSRGASLPPAYRSREGFCDSARAAEKSDRPEDDPSGLPNTLQFQANGSDCEALRPIAAERAGFEPAEGFDPFAALAKRCFRPLSHLSERRRNSTSPVRG